MKKFLGLFGYQREGKFAKCMWWLFAGSVTIIALSFAVYSTLVAISYSEYMSRKDLSSALDLNNHICYVQKPVVKDSYIYDWNTREKTIKGIAWIARPNWKDSLVCYSDGKLRGYFNIKDGRIVIKPQYKHAWVFSDGVAAVEVNGYIKFIDGKGNVVLDTVMKYDSNCNDYVFHSGYMVVKSFDGTRYGLMDKTGAIVMPTEYDNISFENGGNHWCIKKDEKTIVYDKDLKPLFSFNGGNVMFDGTIRVTTTDHIVRRYDYDGNLIHDFCISTVKLLEYKSNNDETEKKTIARLRSYTAGDGYEGLITADGYVVTMPKYRDIEAIGPDLYMCGISIVDRVIVNGKGEEVR